MSAFLKEIAEPRDFNFASWQTDFSLRVVKNKFEVLTWSMASGGLLSQLNLLLEGTCDGELSDLALASHFAHRRVPLQKNTQCSTGAPVAMKDCAGWLYIADFENRVLGHSLLYHEGPMLTQISDGATDWQTTLFAPVNKDPLLYLSSWGYLTAMAKEDSSDLQLKAHRVIRGFWSKNAAGLVNFQIPRAAAHSGAMLEVLGSVALCNAAAISSGDVINIKQFLVNLIRELGVECNAKELGKIWARDSAFQDVYVPRCLFPGLILPAALVGFAGLVTRHQDSEQLDVVVKYLLGRINLLRVEMKNRDSLSTKEIGTIVENVLQEEGAFGIIMVRGCNHYWDQYAAKNLDELKAELKNLYAGKVYFISNEGECYSLSVNTKRKGRVVLIQVPPEVLGQK